LVNGLFEIIKETLENGENVLIAGFGKFQVRFKWARKGRNPQTGEQIILKSRRIVSFRCSPKLKEKINKSP
jgi:integration host factor subunit alpha